MIALERFRHETREWLARNCPPGARGPGQIAWGSSKVALGDDVALWLQRMAGRGWTVPTWPREYGGAELTSEQYLVLLEELRRIDARSPLTGRGVNYIGPTLLDFGTPEQKARWLPGIARGEGGWCMGYSEPGAGSDLANLSTRAVRDGDHYRINGRKIWTSDATESDYIFALVRTDPSLPKHDGISLVLIDMRQPGVTVRPIRLISGNSPFCETLFEDALVRSTHAGINISGTQGREIEVPLADVAKRYVGRRGGRIADPPLRERLTRLEMNQHAYRLTQRRVIEETRARAPGFASSAVKLSGALLAKERSELHLDILGFAGLGWDGPGFEHDELGATRTWLRQKAATIAGGTAEVQLNIIAKRVLGLPD
jgi:alkylation response protein AidB-like acyl-CoA dehydrogenase